MTGVFEALSPYAKPTDAVNQLRGLEIEVDKVAQRTGCTELESYQVMKPLGLNHVHELMALKSLGLRVVRFGGRTTVDIRDFHRWVRLMCEEIAARPWTEPDRRFDHPVQGVLL